MRFIIYREDHLCHHGVKGMKWGVRKDTKVSGYTRKQNSYLGSQNTVVDPYSKVVKRANYKLSQMSKDEYARACSLWNSVVEVNISQQEKERVYEELDNWLTSDEKASAIVTHSIDNYTYTAVNKGHNQYKIFRKEPTNGVDPIIDEVLVEMFGPDWRIYDEWTDR